MEDLHERLAKTVARIRAQSSFSVEETERIIRKYFTKIPKISRFLVPAYQLDQKRVLEIGGSYGHTLFFWGPNSAAIEASTKCVEFMRALGVKVYELNVEDDTEAIDEPFDVIFTNNLFEHLISPHLFLARIHSILRPDGLLVVGHPLVPHGSTAWLWKLIGYRGWLADEHVNFFTPETARLTLERGGYEVLDQWCPVIPLRWRWLHRLLLPFTVQVVSVCRRIEDYKYAALTL